MTVREHGARMRSLTVTDGDYPDRTALPVRTAVGAQVSDRPSPRDTGVKHEARDFPVRWLREREEGFQSVPLAAGLLLMAPCTLDFTFVGDETILLVSGAIDVVDDEGNVAHLRGGDMAYFAAGTATTWTVLEESVELFTILG
jgi:uncharacterized cupin superfamily protein